MSKASREGCNNRMYKHLVRLLIAVAAVELSRNCTLAESAAKPAIDIGTRVEMFVDDFLIDPASRHGVSLQLQAPVRREVVLTTDKPWEGHASAYYTVLQDGLRFRLYYRGSGAKSDASEEQFTCYAES